MRKWWVVLIGIVLLIALGVGGVALLWGSGPLPSVAGSGYRPFELKLELDKAPAVNEPVLITFTIIPKSDTRSHFPAMAWVRFRYVDSSEVPGVANAEVVGNLPLYSPWRPGQKEPVMPTERDPAWRGFAKKGQPIQFSATVRFPKEGLWEVFAEALEPGARGASASRRLTVRQDRGEFGWPCWPEGAPPPRSSGLIMRDGKWESHCER